jgi:hypothetical protein
VNKNFPTDRNGISSLAEYFTTIALQHVEPAVVEDLAETAFANCENSVRMFLGIIISEDANRKLKEMESRQIASN